MTDQTPDPNGADPHGSPPGPTPSAVPGEEPHGVDPELAEAETDAEVAAALASEPAGDPATYGPDDIEVLLAERDQFLDAYRRTAADFDNFRKQSQRRTADEVARSQGAFVERLLPVLDAVDAARALARSNGSAAADQGVEALAGALFGFLEREGLERVDPVGAPFDPTVAEAVLHEPGDGDPTVVEVLRTGYLWNGRVIRAAMVKVAG